MSRFLTQNAKVVANGFIYGKLYNISWFPGAVLGNVSAGSVYGTVFYLHNLKVFNALDRFEGYNINQPKKSLFIRKITTVFLENNTTLSAWVYLYNQNVDNKKQILSGDFLNNANT